MTEKRLTTDQIIPLQLQCLLLNAVTPKFSSLHPPCGGEKARLEKMLQKGH